MIGARLPVQWDGERVRLLGRTTGQLMREHLVVSSNDNGNPGRRSRPPSKGCPEGVEAPAPYGLREQEPRLVTMQLTGEEQ